MRYPAVRFVTPDRKIGFEAIDRNPPFRDHAAINDCMAHERVESAANKEHVTTEAGVIQGSARWLVSQQSSGRSNPAFKGGEIQALQHGVQLLQTCLSSKNTPVVARSTSDVQTQPIDRALQGLAFESPRSIQKRVYRVKRSVNTLQACQLSELDVQRLDNNAGVVRIAIQAGIHPTQHARFIGEWCFFLRDRQSDRSVRNIHGYLLNEEHQAHTGCDARKGLKRLAPGFADSPQRVRTASVQSKALGL